MNLPIPTAAQIAEFKQIYLEEFGKVLTEKEAWETATITLQLFYLGTYGLKTKVPDGPGALGEAHKEKNPGAGK